MSNGRDGTEAANLQEETDGEPSLRLAALGTRSLESVGSGPLEGTLVLDLGRGAVGPVAASQVAMLGATVIKIERPTGEPIRTVLPRMGDVATLFLGNNVGKFGLVCDLKDARDREVVVDLAGHSDIVIENFRSSEVARRLKLDYTEDLVPRNPRLVYIQASSFGSSGPLSGMASIEWTAEAASGMAASTGEDGGDPELCRGAAYLDWTGANVNTIAMLAGLILSRSRGTAVRLETSQFGSAVFASLSRVTGAHPNGADRQGSRGVGVVPDRIFATVDGYISVTATSNTTWKRLCGAVDRPDLADDGRFASNRDRIREYRLVEAELCNQFAHADTATWLAKLREARVPCSEHTWGLTIPDKLLSDPQVVDNGMLQLQRTMCGELLTQSPQWQFTLRPASLGRPAPQMGEHNQLIRTLARRLGSTTKGRNRGNTPVSLKESLDGVKVLEIGSGLPVAMAVMILTQLGATVQKIANPAGDWLLDWGGDEGGGRLWRALNSHKRVERLDLKSGAGRSSLQVSLQGVDVVLAAGTPSRRHDLGYDLGAIRTIATGAIYCGISGWGTMGPLSDQPATELDVQVASGMTLLLGRPGEMPVRVGYDLVSVNTALVAVQAILAAVLSVSRDEIEGQHGEAIELSMLQTAISLSQMNVVAGSNVDRKEGRVYEAYRWPPDHGYRCADRHVYISFGGYEEAWSRFFIALGRADLLIDERFSQIDRLRDNEYLLPILLKEELARWTYDDLEKLVRDELGGTVVPLFRPTEVLRHPQVKVLDFIHISDDGDMEFSLPIRVGG